jgi:hypothetical protein
MARSKNKSNHLDKVIELALTGKDIKSENIIRLVKLLENSIAAVEILNGVDEAPDLPSPKDTYKMYGHWSKIINFNWNPLNKKVICEYSHYVTMTVEHSFEDDDDILLLKEKFFACTSKEQAKNIPTAGKHSMKVIINSLEKTTIINNSRSESYYIDSWEDLCNAVDYFEDK